MTKLITGIIGLLIIFACTKDEIIPPDDQNHISITGTGARDGRVLPQLYMGSLTIWDANTKTQVILDRSSLSLFEFAKIRDKKPERMGIPHTGEMYTATQWRVIIHWKSGKTFYSGLYSMKDTSVNRFTLTSFRGQSIGASYLEFKQTESYRNYYDYRYHRNKRTYLYQYQNGYIHNRDEPSGLASSGIISIFLFRS
jgi:hypothetical protein